MSFRESRSTRAGADAPPTLNEAAHNETAVRRLTWPQLEARAPAAVGLLPVGAAAKEHGHHLPLGTDAMQVEWLCHKLANGFSALVWPTVQYGHYPAFGEFPGSPSLDRDCFESTLRAVIDGMRRSGHRSMVLVNSGISTIPAVDAVCNGGCIAWHIYSGARYLEAVAAVEQQHHGGHADELETSLLLYIAGDRVRPGLAVPEDRPFGPGPLNRNRPGEGNYTATGAMGDPSRASRDKGERLARAMLEDGREILRRL